RGRTDPLRAAQGQRCTARYIPAGQLDELVWADLCALLTDPAHLTRALARAQGGAWLPQELQARQATIGQALGQLERQQRRLLAELLIDRVVVTDGQVEIRYVLPTSPDGPHRPFCQLRKDHLDELAGAQLLGLQLRQEAGVGGELLIGQAGVALVAGLPGRQ